MTGCAGIGLSPPTRPSVGHCACPVLWRLGFAAVPMDGSLLEDFDWVEKIVKWSLGWIRKLRTCMSLSSLVLCSINRYDDVSSQRFDDTSIDTAGPVSILWHVCSSGT